MNALYGYAGLAVALLLALGWGVSLQRDVARGETRIAELQRDMSEAAAEAEAEKNRIELGARARIELARMSYQAEIENAKANHARTIADLRSGAERLRWSLECPPAPDLPDAPAGTARADDRAELRRADAEHAIAEAIRIADACDAHVRAAQGVIEAGRVQDM